MTSDAPTEPASQTLSRGIRILEILAEVAGPLSIAQIASALGVHRSIAYRLLRTLEAHRLVTRDGAGNVSLGARIAALAAGVAHDLQAEALPELTSIANQLGMTSFVAVLDHDECVTLTSVEPRHSVASLAQRPGTRHSVQVGAPGKAILSVLSASRWPESVSAALRSELADAAARGYATSHDEVIPSLRAVAVPITLRGRNPAALAVVYVASPHAPDDIARVLAASAARIQDALG